MALNRKRRSGVDEGKEEGGKEEGKEEGGVEERKGRRKINNKRMKDGKKIFTASLSA